MAKILDNFFPNSAKKLMKLRLNRQWVQDQLEALPRQLQSKTDRKLQKYAWKLEKRLEEHAFAACDKTLYAESTIASRLQRFDQKQYMRYREVNYGFAKAVFKRILQGMPWEDLQQKQRQQVAALRDAREAYVKKQELWRESFLRKHSGCDDTRYRAVKEQLQAEYARKEQDLRAKQERQLAGREASLRAKWEKLDEKIRNMEPRADSGIVLPEDVLLRVVGLKMYFGGLKAVDDLTFDVKKGEIFGLIGPNGAGKTTVFNCITRFYDATGGNMYFVNKDGITVDMRSFRVHDVILQGITRTFQNVELVKEVSVLDNLLIACTRNYHSGIAVHALGLPRLRREETMLRQKAMDILRFMGLESYAQWLALGLPYGILKKVEIARALMAGASLIIMDEPAAGLNDSETAELTRLIRRIRDEFHVTILLVEHDMGLVMNVCDTVCAISFGKMLAIGTCEEIKANKAVQEAYLGVEEDG